MRIGGLAKPLGIATSKIRFLESRDLVYSSRLPNGHRDYDQESLLTLQTVLLAQSFGLTLAEINSAFLEIQGRGLRYCSAAPGKIQQLDQHTLTSPFLTHRYLRFSSVLMIAACEGKGVYGEL